MLGIDGAVSCKEPHLCLETQAIAADMDGGSALADGESAVWRQPPVQVWNAAMSSTRSLCAKHLAFDVRSEQDRDCRATMTDIIEQPAVIHRALAGCLDDRTGYLRLPQIPFDVAQVERLSILACGSAYIAGMIGRYWLERFTGLRVDLDLPSESMLRGLQPDPRQPLLVIDQSGETAENVKAIRFARRAGQPTLSIVDVADSTIAVESEQVLLTRAGRDIGAAPIRSFIAQLTVLAAFTVETAQARGRFSSIESSLLVAELNHIAGEIDAMLRQDADMDAIAAALAYHDHVLFVGHGGAYPTAEAGALTLKSVASVHSDACPTGELEHRPIIGIDNALAVVVVAPPDEWFDRTLSVLRDLALRGGRVILLSDEEGIKEALPFIAHGVALPPASTMLAPLVYTLPLQLLAYKVALLRRDGQRSATEARQCVDLGVARHVA